MKRQILDFIKGRAWLFDAARWCYDVWDELISYGSDFLMDSGQSQKRVLIFAQGRTGSTVLENLLCSTGHFSENGELLNTTFKREVLSPVRYIRGKAKRAKSGHFVFHVKIYHLTEDRKRAQDPRVFVEALYKDGWDIVYLQRSNKVEHALSNIVALHRGTYHKTSSKSEDMRLTVDLPEFKRRVRDRFAIEVQEREVLKGFEFLEVVYEDDLMDSEKHQSTVDRMLDCLSLERREVSTQYRKVNSKSKRDIISNYNDFLECVKSEGWSEMLRD
ncbi:MAG: hypothetical protein F6K21_25190 [Symploca sp. SIO2D2]|nr:hypothetical protein [Symploca sp. SIO2D2]